MPVCIHPSGSLLLAACLTLTLVGCGAKEMAKGPDDDRHAMEMDATEVPSESGIDGDTAFGGPRDAWAEDTSDSQPAEDRSDFAAPRVNAPSIQLSAPENADSAFSAPQPERQFNRSNAKASELTPSYAYAESNAAPSPDVAKPDFGPFENLPAGATYSDTDGFATVAVYYATDRAADPLPLSAYSVSGDKLPLMLIAGTGFVFFAVAGFSIFRGRSAGGAMAGLVAGVCVVLSFGMVSRGMANIEKHGVNYTAERGVLTRGIAEVTVPATHERGEMESPSLLRFEFAEDQQQHIVLTSATELSALDFQTRLRDTVASAPGNELMVFIHGYNVDFESAVRRTAQLAIDLPCRGVPVCYSWPSQGTLFGYTIDENNAAWTASHLRQFLTELASESGAKSINLVAHSMGNRALTSALSEISMSQPRGTEPMFEHVVLAAPDVDADYFRKDLAPRVLATANSVTLYASSDDRALIASKQVHGYPRAGESGPDLVVIPGIDTIDVSGIDLSLLGHSYYGDSGLILTDLFELMQQRLPAKERRFLRPHQVANLVYWRLAGGGLAEGLTAPLR